MKSSKFFVFCLAACQVSAESVQTPEEPKNILKNKKGSQTTVGLSIGKYRYKEPSVMDINGNMFGLDYASTFGFDSEWFFKGDISFAYIKGKYTSNNTGSLNNDTSWYLDMRPLLGTNFVFEQNALAPFIGFGYRMFRNDTSGRRTTTGAVGYNRINQLLYIPVGVIHRTALYGSACLETTAELDVLIQGKQYSGIDGGVTNKQTKGYGLRLSSEYKTDRFSIGPYVKYWNIADSNVVRGIYEPKNSTLEMGVRFSLSF